MPKKILLADDSITIQKVVELTFSEGDYEVVCVGNGALAIRKIDEIVPDIALVDIMMPMKNGYEVCAHVKQNPDLAWIPVLLLTGTFEPFDARRADQVGAEGHITKPFESRALVAQVEDLLARHPRPRAAEPEHAPIRPAAAEGRPEIVNAGQIFTPRTEPPLQAPAAATAPSADFGPATVRVDSRAFFARAGARGDVLETPPAAPPSLGPLDLDASVDEGEPTQPHPASALAAASPAPAPEAAPPALPPADEVRRLVEARIEEIARPIVREVVDRILREVAWEVIPEVAEAEVRRRIRELESEASQGGPPALH